MVSLLTAFAPFRSAIPAMIVATLTGLATGQPTFVNLGTLPGTEGSSSRGISDDGTVVVGQSGIRVFRWSAGEGMRHIGFLQGSGQATAYGVSGDGSTVVGQARVFNTPNQSNLVAFRSTAEGMQNLGTLEPNSVSTATGVSHNGATVVGWGPTTFGIGAFRWQAGSGMELLPALPGEHDTLAYAVDAAGTTVVGTSGHRAFIWTPQGGTQDLGAPVGGFLTTPVAISADGTAAVGHYVLPGVGRAFRWTASEGMHDLGVLPGGRAADAIDISGDGSTVVGVAEAVGFNRAHAFLWNVERGMVDLNEYLPSLGVDLQGWELTEANGVSFDGTTITGTGYFGFQLRAWVVSGIPAPGGAGLYLAGLCVFSIRRRL